MALFGFDPRRRQQMGEMMKRILRLLSVAALVAATSVGSAFAADIVKQGNLAGDNYPDRSKRQDS